MNIVLVGYRCSGKTSIGRYIAGKMDRIFLDTDVLIEDKAGSSIEEMVSRNGWERFRETEKGVIRDISSKNRIVVATGGGVVLDGENIKELKRNGFIIWLTGSPVVLRDRMEKDMMTGTKRPPLTGEDPLDEIEQVLKTRDNLYREAGDFMVDTDRLAIGEAADLIIRFFNRR